ncbi:MAG: hypothetical protein NT040_05735 [Bacteroidetes bacterium]|nr:hypothetical protein [Bacteroidota bacterium]
MRKLFTFFALCVLGMSSLSAQELIAVNHVAGGSEFFTRLDSAVIHSANGDYIYLPGTALMNIGNLVINKGVHIIGAGIFPDSCYATGTTFLTGNITIVSGADNGSLQGFMLNGVLTFGTSQANQHVSSYYVSRCNLSTVYLSNNGTDTTTTSFLFRENIIRGHVYGGHSNASFRNNILEGQLNYFYGATFLHNDFLWGSSKTLNFFVKNSTFSNNIFKNPCVAYYGYIPVYCVDNNYYYNLFNGPIGFFYDYYGYCVANLNGFGNMSGNHESVPNEQIYTSQVGNAYDIHHNYHLVAGSPGINGGSDGTDCGIYGGEPFKDGMLPVNPHIQFKYVAGSTNPAGTLNIHFKVAAQEK